VQVADVALDIQMLILIAVRFLSLGAEAGYRHSNTEYSCEERTKQV